MLNEFQDVLINEHLKDLPSEKNIDNKIELVLKAEPQNNAPY